MTVRPSMPGILRSAISRSYGYIRMRSGADRPSGATSTSYSASASVLASRSRMLASSSTTRTRGRALPAGAGRGGAEGVGPGPPGRGGRRPRAAASWPLAIEPRVDVAFAEPPLPADPNGGNLAGLDQAVHRAQVDLEVLEDF